MAIATFAQLRAWAAANLTEEERAKLEERATRRALEYERDHGSGSAEERAAKVRDHLLERPAYYVELAAMMDPDRSPELRRALTPGELRKAAEGGWERGPRGGKRRRVGGKWVYARSGGEGGRSGKGADSEGKGPKSAGDEDAPKFKAEPGGFTLDKFYEEEFGPKSSWPKGFDPHEATKRSTAELKAELKKRRMKEGMSAEEADKEAAKAAKKFKEQVSGGKGSKGVVSESAQGGHPEMPEERYKEPKFKGEDGGVVSPANPHAPKAGDEEGGAEGSAPEPTPQPGEETEPHPDAPHDAHQTTIGAKVSDVIDHLHSIHPEDLRKRGEALAEEIGRKDPEAGKRVKALMIQLEHAVRRGRAGRSSGKDTRKDDMTAAEALKKIMRDFNSAAAPASVLGPELGGILKPDKEVEGNDASARAAAAERRKSAPKKKGAKPPRGEKGEKAPKGKKPPKRGKKGRKAKAPRKKLKKALPTMPPIGGSAPRDETPAIPDFQGLFFQPETDERRQRNRNIELNRREAVAKRNAGRFGFHGLSSVQHEPAVRYEPNPENNPPGGKRISSRGPVVRADQATPRLAAGSALDPEKDGSRIKRRSDEGRVPRSPDRREDEIDNPRRPVAKMTNEKREEILAFYRHRAENPRSPVEDLVGYYCDVFGVGPAAEERLRKRYQATKSLLVGDLMKAARGGKYIKRVPYTDAKGRRRYRYYYRESAVAREAKVGEEVKVGKERLRVDAIAEDGTMTITIGGKSRKITREQYTQLLARHYGYRYYEYAEKRAKQAINAVFRHVPKAMLADLKGDSLEERLADLKARAPKVYAKLQASFQRAGVSPARARDIVERTLERRGWAPEARAAAIGSVLTQRVKADTFYEVLRGAENLAAGDKVQPKHVGALVELRHGEGSESFPDRVAKIAAQAEAELAKLKRLLAAAQDGSEKAQSEALAEALASNAIAKLNLLTQAFPGLKDKAAEEARETLLEVPSVASGPPKTKGAETVVFVAGEGGEPKALKARYELREAGDVIASHDPTRGFQKRGDYPDDVQERAYHRDRDEQMKVMKNAQRLRPEFVINTNPDAVNGPPMITEDGRALGGNSRTMSMQLAYHEHPEVAARMRDYLAEHAHEVGFRQEDVAALKNPVLVRVIENPQDEATLLGPGGKRKHSKQEMQVLVRQMNESFTQAMDPRTMQVAMGRKLDDSTIKSLADGMQEGETLAQFLTSSRATTFVNKLGQIGIIDARNANQYKDPKTQRLNADGRTLVSRILVGRLVGDADVLANTQPRTVDSVARAVPHLVAATAHGKGYDLGDDMAAALRDLNELRRRQADGTIRGVDPAMSEEDFDGFYAQQSLFGGGSHDIDLESKGNDRAKVLLWALIKKPGSQQLASLFKDYAQQASHYPEGQALLGQEPKSPAEVLRDVVDRATKKKAKAKAGAKEQEPKAEPEQPRLLG